MNEMSSTEAPDSVPNSHPDSYFDLLVIGAGPTGLACAIEAQKAGFRTVLVDKGCLCNSLFHYPSHMTFFTTPELLEIGDIPFPSPNPKPTRNEALQYYRLVAAHYKLDIRQYRRVDRVTGADGAFTVHMEDRFGRPSTLRSRKLAVSTGYYDLANYMNIPGERLDKVMHYYVDPHPYFDMDVLVIGGKNSAAIAALELWRNGARHPCASRRRDAPARKVLDQAGHREPHQERRNQSLLSFARGRDRPRQRAIGNAPRSCDTEERLRLRHDRLSS